MKKISILLAFILLCGVSAQAIENSSQVPNSCYVGAYPISNPVSRGIQSIFGLNFLTTKIAEAVIKSQVSNLLQKGSVKVHLKGYSAGDLIAGKVKSFEVTGKNLVFNDIYLSSFDAKSLCDFTSFSYMSKPPMLKSPLFLGYKADITNDNLSKTFSSSSIKDSLQNIDIQAGIINLGKISFVDVKPSIINKKLKMKANMQFHKAFISLTIPINFETSLKAQNNKIYLTGFKFAPDAVSSDLKFITDFLELTNIPVLDLNSMEKNNSEINIKKIKIVDDKISIEGTFWQPQNTTL